MSNLDCNAVHNVTGGQAQCDFVRNNTNCQDVSGYINYVQVLYCDFKAEEAGGIILYVIWITFLFIGMGKLADDYLCPNLAVVSKTLQ